MATDLKRDILVLIFEEGMARSYSWLAEEQAPNLGQAPNFFTRPGYY